MAYYLYEGLNTKQDVNSARLVIVRVSKLDVFQVLPILVGCTGKSQVTRGTIIALTLNFFDEDKEAIVNLVIDCLPSLCGRPAMPQIFTF